MLTYILIALAAVIFLIAYDYFHNRATYKFTDHWLKYTVAFIVGAFLFPLLAAWKFFWYIEVAAITILAGIFWSVITNWIQSLLHKKPVA